MVASIIVEIPISKKGEMKFFEVNIPEDVTLVFDTEATIRGISDARFIHNANIQIIAGLLKLKSENAADLQFQSVITFGSSPVEDLLPGYAGLPNGPASLPTTPYYENSYKPVPTLNSVDSYTLYGCYEDLLGCRVNTDISYSISLCFWTKVKETAKS